MPKTTAQKLAAARRARQVADREIARLDAVALAERRAQNLEPADKSVVRFSASYNPGGPIYNFVAIRCDNWRKPTATRDGHPRWYISQTNDLGKPVTIPSPATWLEIARLAVPNSVFLAPPIDQWTQLSNLVASDASSGVDIRIDPDQFVITNEMLRGRVPGYGY